MQNDQINVIQTRLGGGIVSALVVICMLTTARPARGEVIYQTGFEAPAFSADLPLVGQDGWIAPPPLSPEAAMVTNDKPRQGRQTVHVLGADLVHQDFINEVTGGYYDAIGSYRRPVNYDTGGTRTVRISAHVRIDGPKTADGDNFFSTSVGTRAETAGGTAAVGEIALSSDGHAYAYSGNENFPTFLASVPAKLGQWHDLEVVADFATHLSTFLVDGESLGTFPFDATEEFTGILLRGSLLVYAGPDTAAASKSDYAATFDHFSIKAVEE